VDRLEAIRSSDWPARKLSRRLGAQGKFGLRIGFSFAFLRLIDSNLLNSASRKLVIELMLHFPDSRKPFACEIVEMHHIGGSVLDLFSTCSSLSKNCIGNRQERRTVQRRHFGLRIKGATLPRPEKDSCCAPASNFEPKGNRWNFEYVAAPRNHGRLRGKSSKRPSCLWLRAEP